MGTGCLFQFTYCEGWLIDFETEPQTFLKFLSIVKDYTFVHALGPIYNLKRKYIHVLA